MGEGDPGRQYQGGVKRATDLVPFAPIPVCLHEPTCEPTSVKRRSVPIVLQKAVEGWQRE